MKWLNSPNHNQNKIQQSANDYSGDVLYLTNPDSKVHGANMGPICGRQDPGGPHVDPMNLIDDDRFFNILFGHTTKKSSMVRITSPFGGNHIPSQRVSDAERVSISWRYNAVSFTWAVKTNPYMRARRSTPNVLAVAVGNIEQVPENET